MRRISRKSLLQRLKEGRKIEARLRGLARRLERFSPEEAEELMSVVQAELGPPFAVSDRILEAIHAKR